MCPHSGGQCVWGSCFERNTCRDFDLELYGLTRPLFVTLTKIAAKDNVAREKRLYNTMSLVFTGKLLYKDAATTVAKNVDNIEAKKKDLLFDFPYDVNYPTEQDISGNLGYWSDYVMKNGDTDLPTDFWDSTRAEACRGRSGIIARRCSVNSLLWDEYKQGKYKDQKTLKSRIKLDHLRLAFYPVATPRNLICSEPPSIEFWETMLKDSRLKWLKEQLLSAGFENIEDVIPVTSKHKELFSLA